MSRLISSWCRRVRSFCRHEPIDCCLCAVLGIACLLVPCTHGEITPASALTLNPNPWIVECVGVVMLLLWANELNMDVYDVYT